MTRMQEVFINAVTASEVGMFGTMAALAIVGNYTGYTHINGLLIIVAVALHGVSWYIKAE